MESIEDRVRRLLGTGTSGQKALNDAISPKSQTDAEFYVLAIIDVTGSMNKHIDAVYEKVKEVGKELFINEQGINMALWGVGDHGEYFGPEEFMQAHTFKSGMYLQSNIFTSGTNSLETAIGNLERTSGGDIPEAYECALKAAGEDIYRLKNEKPGSNFATVLIIDSIPHGMNQTIYTDRGCPDGVDYKKSLLDLSLVSNYFWVVGCSEDKDMIELQKQLINPQDPHQKFIQLGDMSKDLHYLIIAGVKQMRNPQSALDYLKALPADTSKRVSEYLSLPPPTQK